MYPDALFRFLIVLLDRDPDDSRLRLQFRLIMDIIESMDKADLSNSFHTLRLPFLEQLAGELAKRRNSGPRADPEIHSRPRFQHLFAGGLESYIKQYVKPHVAAVGAYSQIPAVQRIVCPESERCTGCALVNHFFDRKTEKAVIFTLDYTSFSHNSGLLASQPRNVSMDRVPSRHKENSLAATLTKQGGGANQASDQPVLAARAASPTASLRSSTRRCSRSC